MHTVRVVVGGIVLLSLFLLAGRWLAKGGHSDMSRAATLFIPVWLVASLVNLWIGVNQAGYTVAQEAPILLVVFGVPAVAAYLASRYLASR